MRKWLIWGGVAVVVLIVIVAACGGGDKEPAAPVAPVEQQPAEAQPVEQAKPTEEPEPTEAPAGVTMAQYEQLETGMTYDEVVAILGEPEQELSSSEIAGIKTAIYQWAGAAPLSNMNATFQDGTLAMKAQFGLK